MSSGSILGQLQKEKKPLFAALFLLIGIGIIRLPMFSPKSAEATADFPGNPQDIHMATLPGGFSAIFPSNAPVGITLENELKTDPEEEAGAFFAAKNGPSPISDGNPIVAAKPKSNELSESAGTGLFVKI